LAAAAQVELEPTLARALPTPFGAPVWGLRRSLFAPGIRNINARGMDRWHIARSEQRSGPFPWSQVVDVARAGLLAPTDRLYTKEFVASPAARDYDRRVAEIEEAGAKD
jgi:hypothetical protein